MFSACKITLLATLCAAGLAAADLRVCAEPEDLPFSNAREQGFENQIARVIAADLGRTVRYHWAAHRGRLLKPLRENQCDLVMGMLAQSTAVRVTRPYYRSAYVFITRPGRAIRSFDDPALRKARIGIQLIGADDASSPPAEELAHRGLIANVSWYRLSETFLMPNPSEMLRGVARGDVDVAVAWGPSAGYFARQLHAPVRLTPISTAPHAPVPMAFAISMGVRPADRELLDALNRAIEHRRVEIRRILTQFGVPLVEDATAAGSIGR